MEDVRKSILEGNAQTIDDVRRDVRLGMGPCQGGFCTFRVAGILHSLRQVDVEATNVALRDFLQERWKGLVPILWGQQLRQERLDELIYRSVLNVDNLPGPNASRLAPIPYKPECKDAREHDSLRVSKAGIQPDHIVVSSAASQRPNAAPPDLDVLIIGAGLAGLATAWQAGLRGMKAHVVTQGWGSLYWNAGCVDILGCSPLEPDTQIESPVQALEKLVRQHPDHPYARTGLEYLDAALRQFQELCAQANYPLCGSLERNWKLPTALGACRPACLAPETMIAGDMGRKDPMWIVGFEHYLDFYPALIASNLEKAGIAARGVLLDLPILRKQRFVAARALAQFFESHEFRAQVVEALRPHLSHNQGNWKAARVGFPAVLGLYHALEVHHDLQDQLGLPVFEIPTLPPSIPGMRLHLLLSKAIEQNGGRIFEGMQATGADADNGQLLRVWSQAAARRRAHPAHHFVLATGGILGGGLTTTPEGLVRETVFGLPVSAPPTRAAWFAREFLAPTGHPIFQPVDPSGQTLYENLWVVGADLAGCDPIRERSVEGIALATGVLVGESLIPVRKGD